jgi:hypothetical protein
MKYSKINKDYKSIFLCLRSAVVEAMMPRQMEKRRDHHILSELWAFAPLTPRQPTTTIYYSMGTKRSWEGQPLELHPETTTDTEMADATETEAQPSSIISIFENFRDELDEHHDRRERIIKKSRDITALSKKMFGLYEH